MNQALNEIYKEFSLHPDVDVKWDEPMSKHTTFKIGGPAKLFCEFKNTRVIISAIQSAKAHGIKPFVMGNGSNLLVSDDGIDGVVFKISGGECRKNDIFINADAGVTLTKLANFAKRMGLCGFEFAYGIPGTVGGAVVMNAGAYGFEMKDVLVETTCVNSNGEVFRLGRKEHEFDYRTSFFKKNPEYTVISTKIALCEGNSEEIGRKMEEIFERRRDKQPLELPSAGSVFKRPAGHYAGALIEQCGLKSCTIGGAQVSEKHAGFIVNIGGATCDDVLRLIEHIKETVLKRCGVELECEVLCAPRKI